MNFVLKITLLFALVLLSSQKICDINCQAGFCNETTHICEQCTQGFQLNEINNLCYKCPSQCQNCTLTPNLTAICTQCDSGYQLHENQCYLCETGSNWGCNQCEIINGQAGKCLGCQQGMILARENNTCMMCNGLCSSCYEDEQGEQVCTDCDFWALKNGTCYTCAEYCDTCKFEGEDLICDKCDDFASKVSNGTCVKCEGEDFLCQKCYFTDNDTKICTECSQGSYLVEGTCVSYNCSQQECIECNETTEQCTMCGQDFYYLFNGTCLKCPDENSVSCIWNQTTQQVESTSCIFNEGPTSMLFPEFFVNKTTKQCQNCPKGCTGCAYEGEEIVCNNCPNGGAMPEFFLNYDGQCQSVNIIEGCINVYLSGGQAFCSYCYLNYTLNKETQLCEKLDCSRVPHCSGCLVNYTSNSLYCLQCSDNYFLNFKQECEECKFSNCQLCGINYGMTVPTCQECSSGYTWNNETFECVKCNGGESCAFCNNELTCKFCQDGYYLNLNNTCQPCSTENCLYCPLSSNSTEDVCQECPTGYFLNGTTCEKCMKNCSYCNNISQCQGCDQNYVLNKDQQCIKSPLEGCSAAYIYNTTTYEYFCGQCENGYYMVEGLCYPLKHWKTINIIQE